MRRLAPLAVAVIAVTYFAVFIGYGVNLEDEGLILFQIARTFRGQLPYVDFHTGYTPGTFYLNAALFHLFGESVMPLRWFLVLVNTAQILLIYTLARPFAGKALAAAAALGYTAFLPCFTGEFASFNVPYPAWYANVFFLLAQWAFDRHLTRGGGKWLLAAGVAVGLAFAFKPNVGVLAALACGLGLALLRGGEEDPDRRGSQLLLLGAIFFLFAAFGFDVVGAQFPLIVGPALFLIIGRLWRARGGSPEALRLWPAVGLIAVGGLIVNAPWIVYFFPKLGLHGFLREVLLVGSGADRIYATPYPVPLGFPEAWPALVALIIVGAGISGVFAERGRMRIGRAIGGLLIVTGALFLFLLSWARMPEGVARSILWQAQYVGFYLVPMMGVVVGRWLLRRLASGPSQLTLTGRRVLGVLVFALCSFVELYPRIDTMHLIVGMPSALVLAAACAARMGRAWGRLFGLSPAGGRGLLALGAGVLSIVVVIPNFDGLYNASLVHQPQVQIQSTRLPVTIEAKRGFDFQAFNAMLAYLQARLKPDEPIFGFPAMPLVPFALGHPTPAPHDYFFPGRPDHRAEVEILRRLQAAPPRFMVTLNRRLGFFAEAPSYYFILRPFLRQQYVLAARFGRYDIFRLRSAPAEPLVEQAFVPTVPDDGIVAALGDPNRDLRRAAAMRILDQAATPADVDAVVARVAPTEASELLVLRNFAEAGDGRALGYAYRTFVDRVGRVRGEAAGVLNFMPLFDWGLPYLLGAARPEVGPGVEVSLDGLDMNLVRFWAADYKLRRQVGVFAGWALAHEHQQDAAPFFQQTVEQETQRQFLQIVSAKGLVALGKPEAMCTLVDLLGIQRHDVQDMMPSFLIGWAAQYPQQLATCLERGLKNDEALGREMSAWLAGITKLTATAPALRAALDDKVPAVRIAATWALGMVQDQAARPALQALTTAADPGEREFAVEAVARIGGS